MAEEPPKAPWTVDRFVLAFIGTEPKAKATIIIEAETVELSERKAARFLEAGEQGGKIHRWEPSNPRHPVRYATVPQPLIEEPAPTKAPEPVTEQKLKPGKKKGAKC